MKEITLNHGYVALVDDEDYDLVKNYKWHYSIGYARTHVNGKKVLMHKLITGLSSNEHLDHKNHNGLDNRRSNLRRCNQTQNLANAKRRKDNTSGAKGVCWDAPRERYCSRIAINGKTIYLGRFEKFADAVKAYEKAANEIYQEFAYTGG